MPRRDAGKTSPAQALGGFKRRPQDTFNKEHTFVRDYGEESEYLVLGNQYSEEEAEQLFREQLLNEFDFDTEGAELALTTMELKDMSCGMWEGEPSYRVGADTIHEARWKAWVLETGY